MLKTIKTVPFSQWTGFKKNFLLLLLSLLCFINFTQTVSAQFSSSVLSGNDPASYVCPGEDPGLPVKSADDTCSAADGKCRTLPYLDSTSGYYVCKSDTGIVRATLKAPPLQQLELWFRRILYAIWAIVGSFSFVMLIYLGYQYMIRGGTSDQELVKLRKAIINYVLGFALVFLSIPILTTFFTVLGINKNVTCYDVAMPGFQFFFPELCTDPNDTYVNNPCAIITDTVEALKKDNPRISLLDLNKGVVDEINNRRGIACVQQDAANNVKSCNIPAGIFSFDVCFICSENYWQFQIGANCQK